MTTTTIDINQLSRYRRLATPKSLPTGFLEDRRSVYWENGIPAKDYNKTTVCVLSPRQAQLVYSKRLHIDYIGDRPSPIWPVSPSALTATPTPRLLQLARSKNVHPNYHPCRGVMTVVPRSALLVTPTHRLCHLAHHKTYSPLQIKPSSEWDWSQWASDVSPAATRAEASVRVVELSHAKQSDPLYKPCREVQWPVREGAKSHTASELTVKLSNPKSRTSGDYNPRAWIVSRAALHAQASPRLSELATPLPRKCRQKKT